MLYTISEEDKIKFRDNPDKVAWSAISTWYKFDDEFILEFADKLDIEQLLARNISISPEIREYLKLLKG